jgi:hypothetical protein
VCGSWRELWELVLLFFFLLNLDCYMELMRVNSLVALGVSFVNNGGVVCFFFVLCLAMSN